MRLPDKIEGWAVALEATNIDTDQIIPARFLLKPRDAGYADLLFHDQRFGPGGRPRGTFPLDAAADGPVRIILCNENFGCGSAREQAVYALSDFGIRAVVAPSFGEIFRMNCIRNGVLPATVSPAEGSLLRSAAAGGPIRLCVLLRQRRLRGEGIDVAFDLADDDLDRLTSGRDEIDATLARNAEILRYEAARYDLPTHGTEP